METKSCIICGKDTLTTFIDFGRQPNANSYPAGPKAKEVLFPIAMTVCRTCWCVQLADFPSPKLLFTRQPYITGLNEPVVEYFRDLVPHIMNKFRIKSRSLVLDIGANDGTLLKIFARHGMSVLGIDPGILTAGLAKARAVPVIRKFWNEKAGESLRAQGILPDLITATAVFYHVPDVHGFVLGVKKVMKKNTVFVVQCLYMKDVIAQNQFENIYHEHRAIYSLGPVKRLFETHGFRLLDVEFSSVHGGSFILYVALPEHPMPTSPNIQKAMDREKEAGLYSLSTYTSFALRARKNMRELHSLLVKLKKRGKRVYLLGAPAKGMMLLNAAGITRDLVTVATEVNIFKINRVTPGTHIPIVDEVSVIQKPDYYLVLSWNYLGYFRQKYRDFLHSGGKFIVPVPKVHIVDI